jgi:hypothetical protein
MSLQKPEVVAYRTGDYKQIMYVDKKTGNQVIEFCIPATGELIARKERGKTAYGADSPWEWSYG